MSLSSVSNPLPARPGLLRRLILRLRGDAVPAPAPPQPPQLAVRRIDPAGIGRGFADPRAGGMKRIVVTVEPAMFERIHTLAQSSGISAAAAIRQLIERGFAAPPPSA